MLSTSDWILRESPAAFYTVPCFAGEPRGIANLRPAAQYHAPRGPPLFQGCAQVKRGKASDSAHEASSHLAADNKCSAIYKRFRQRQIEMQRKLRPRVPKGRADTDSEFGVAHP